MVRTPWEVDPPPIVAPTPLPLLVADPKPRGRRPAPSCMASVPVRPAWLYHPWLYHHLTVIGPAAATREFAAAARGPGVIPWRIDGAALKEDVFNLAVAQPPGRRALDVAGCRILARQFRDRSEARQARAVALVGAASQAEAAPRACPFDLHTLLPVPDVSCGMARRTRPPWPGWRRTGALAMACAMWPSGPTHDLAAGCRGTTP